MAGASRAHNRISTNTTASLHTQLRGRDCDIYQSDMRVQVSERRYVYPDVIVVCGERAFVTLNGLQSLLNPTLLIEVLSDSTTAYDENEKLFQYMQMPSVTDVLIVAQTACRVWHHQRQEQGRWLVTPWTAATDVIQLPVLSCTLALADIYESIEF